MLMMKIFQYWSQLMLINLYLSILAQLIMFQNQVKDNGHILELIFIPQVSGSQAHCNFQIWKIQTLFLLKN